MNETNQESAKKQCCSTQDFKNTAEAHLTDLQLQIESLKEKSMDLVGEAKSEYEATLASLEESQVSFNTYLTELSEKAEDKWDNFKDEAEEKFASLKNNVHDFFSKYS